MIEIIPKPTKKEPVWTKILLFFSIAVLVGITVAFFLFGYFIGEEEKTLESTKKILAQPRSTDEQKLERRVFQYQRKIDDFTLLINQHKVSSDFFTFLEGITHPQVWISELNLNIQTAEVKLSGEAEKTALGQQLLIFRENEQILRTDLSNVQVKEGEKVGFTILLSLHPEIFKFLK